MWLEENEPEIACRVELVERGYGFTTVTDPDPSDPTNPDSFTFDSTWWANAAQAERRYTSASELAADIRAAYRAMSQLRSRRAAARAATWPGWERFSIP